MKPVVPLRRRENRAYLFMKELVYVYDHNFAWNRSFFPLASRDLNMSFVGGWNVDPHYAGWDEKGQGEMIDIEDREHGVVSFGKMNQTQFVHELGMSKILVGVGNPWWSPSPYDALCRVGNIWHSLESFFIDQFCKGCSVLESRQLRPCLCNFKLNTSCLDSPLG
jgi:hypothetical protein